MVVVIVVVVVAVLVVEVVVVVAVSLLLLLLFLSKWIPWQTQDIVGTVQGLLDPGPGGNET